MSRIEVLRFDLVPLAREQLHAHDEALLLHASVGAVHLATAESLWLATPGSAVWVPPGWPSGVSNTKGRARITPIHLHGSLPRGLPSTPCGVSVRPFFASLIAELGNADDHGERAVALQQLILHELIQAPVHNHYLPRPADPALRRAATAQCDDVAQPLSVAKAAVLAGMSERTFTRRFRSATGLNWARWSNEARLLAAARLLVGGATVSQAAFACGYESCSAFANAFRRRFGTVPSLARQGGALLA